MHQSGGQGGVLPCDCKADVTHRQLFLQVDVEVLCLVRFQPLQRHSGLTNEVKAKRIFIQD